MHPFSKVSGPLLSPRLRFLLMAEVQHRSIRAMDAVWKLVDQDLDAFCTAKAWHHTALFIATKATEQEGSTNGNFPKSRKDILDPKTTKSNKQQSSTSDFFKDLATSLAKREGIQEFDSFIRCHGSGGSQELYTKRSHILCYQALSEANSAVGWDISVIYQGSMWYWCFQSCLKLKQATNASIKPIWTSTSFRTGWHFRPC